MGIAECTSRVALIDSRHDDQAIRNVNWVFRDGYGFDSAKLIEAIEGSVGLR